MLVQILRYVCNSAVYNDTRKAMSERILALDSSNTLVTASISGRRIISVSNFVGLPELGYSA
jgi:trehalose-6-phosphatase